jgi:DNA-binding beta-propeller fold protein YncE
MHRRLASKLTGWHRPPADQMAVLLTLSLVLTAACQPHSQSSTPRSSASPSAVPTTAHRRFIYAAQSNGLIQIYDVDHSHQVVGEVDVFGCCADVRGAAAAAATHRFYVMYNRNNEGHVVAIDLLDDHILWDKVIHSPGVDRGNITPDGKILYVPTWEGDPKSPYELAIDAGSGAELARISLPPLSHDTVVSLDGTRVFMETKSATHAMYVADTSTNQVVETITGYCCTGVLAPFSVNGAGTKIVNDVYGYYGFAVADVTAGHVTAFVPFVGTSGSAGHGIAWTPDEREVWADDGSNPIVHVFDMTTNPPTQTQLVTASNIPHWVTFSIDGRFAYVAGRKGTSDPTDVIDTKTYLRIGQLDPSEDLLEVDFTNGVVTAVGNQFGVGRVAG